MILLLILLLNLNNFINKIILVLKFCLYLFILLWRESFYYKFLGFVFRDGKTTDKIFTAKRIIKSFFLSCHVDLLSLIGVSEVFRTFIFKSGLVKSHRFLIDY